MSTEAPSTPPPSAPRRANSVHELRRSFSNGSSPHVVTNHMDFISKLKEEEKQYNYKKQLAKLRLQHPEWSGGPFEDFLRRLEKGKQRDRVRELQRWAKTLSRSGAPVTPSRVREFLDLVGEAYSTPRRSTRRRDSPDLGVVDQRALSFDEGDDSKNEEALAEEWQRVVDEIIATDETEDNVIQYVAGESNPPSPNCGSEVTGSPSSFEESVNDAVRDALESSDDSTEQILPDGLQPLSPTSCGVDGVDDSTSNAVGESDVDFLDNYGDYTSDEATQQLLVDTDGIGQSDDALFAGDSSDDVFGNEMLEPLLPPPIARAAEDMDGPDSSACEIATSTGNDSFEGHVDDLSHEETKTMSPPAGEHKTDNFGVHQERQFAQSTFHPWMLPAFRYARLRKMSGKSLKYGMVSMLAALFATIFITSFLLWCLSMSPNRSHATSQLYPPGFQVTGTTVLRSGKTISPAWTLTRVSSGGARESIQISMRRLKHCGAPEEPVPIGPWFLSSRWWKVRRFAIEQRKMYRKSKANKESEDSRAIAPPCFL